MPTSLLVALEGSDTLDYKGMSLDDAFEYLADSALREFDEELDTGLGGGRTNVRTTYVRANRGVFRDPGE
jgi:hypothetical protein